MLERVGKSSPVNIIELERAKYIIQYTICLKKIDVESQGFEFGKSYEGGIL